MRKKIRLVLLSLFAALLLLSGGMLLRDHIQNAREQDANHALAELMHSAELVVPVSVTAEPFSDPFYESASVPQNSQEPTPKGKTILPQFADLYEMNNDIVGWLTVEGAEVDYPVMYTPEEQNYYLHRAFDGSDSVSGTLFIGVPWGDQANHAIIYGHHMKNGTMFGSLNRYANEEFGKENATIRFDTLYDRREYELVAVFYSKVYPADDKSHFHYYEYADLSQREDFEYYVEQVRAAALYDTGVHPEWGDSLLTLSTCEYHTQNGRFAVVFRQITEE